MRSLNTPVGGLTLAGTFVMRSALTANLLWIGALKFKRYEVENIEPLVTASPLLAWFRRRLGANNLARLIGITEITLGSLISAKPLAPRASAAGSFGAATMFLITLSFLISTPGARQEGEGVWSPSLVGQFLVKDSVLLGASLVTAADALRGVNNP
ncbi:DUF417 family protein [Rugosimonospora africana]|uniref:Membrane protein n=1 Tax=Rugosimonospora africana TaxID=556532 RepID=A0A8J3VX97_9ACTN|nr:DUF417 family protein [Rugosimonospora africana]GIH21641.1 membrane protein [Rugosimonospora africana]